LALAILIIIVVAFSRPKFKIVSRSLLSLHFYYAVVETLR
jgi:hypothetical protein